MLSKCDEKFYALKNQGVPLTPAHVPLRFGSGYTLQLRPALDPTRFGVSAAIPHAWPMSRSGSWNLVFTPVYTAAIFHQNFELPNKPSC
jgi:hypothetical protein